MPFIKIGRERSLQIHSFYIVHSSFAYLQNFSPLITNIHCHCIRIERQERLPSKCLCSIRFTMHPIGTWCSSWDAICCKQRFIQTIWCWILVAFAPFRMPAKSKTQQRNSIKWNIINNLHMFRFNTIDWMQFYLSDCRNEFGNAMLGKYYRCEAVLSNLLMLKSFIIVLEVSHCTTPDAVWMLHGNADSSIEQ